MTVFSAPDYPQFQLLEEGEERYNNLAAVAMLRAPSYAEPEMRQFEARQPRPEVRFHSVKLGSDLLGGLSCSGDDWWCLRVGCFAREQWKGYRP